MANDEIKEENAEGDVDDEFSKLLYDFINQGSEQTSTDTEQTKQTVESTPQPDITIEPEAETLDSFYTTLNEGIQSKPTTEEAQNTSEESDLDSFISEQSVTTENATVSLNDFATGQTKSSKENEQANLDSFVSESSENLDNFANEQPNEKADSLDAMVNATSETNPTETVEPVQEEGLKLKNDEKELATALSGFMDGVKMLSIKKNLKVPEIDYKPEQLYPNYKPSIGRRIANYMLECWDLIYKYDPQCLKTLNKNATDEDYLSFAENLKDEELQFTIYSYIETLYNLENCEIIYNQKLDTIQKNRIKRELYDDYMRLQQRKLIFIQKLKEKGFPIDEDRLIGNYFHAAQKDADGAFKALTENPATFSPIDFNKIKPRFFGLIKVSPEDGIKANQKIGSFIKKLKA